MESIEDIKARAAQREAWARAVIQRMVRVQLPGLTLKARLLLSTSAPAIIAGLGHFGKVR